MRRNARAIVHCKRRRPYELVHNRTTPKQIANHCRVNALTRMPHENDLEGEPDMGGKHGGQAGQPKPPPRPAPQDKEGQRDADVVAKRHTGQTDRKFSPTNTK
ncbi:hypothetical protein [Bradyrhizobium sp. McL0616]|uniref:hypothetical protein n=1 Tax=Bradyrhizobium sp. McL0616 TaxID=3415674 RepID=UPI003CF4DD57